MIIGEERSGKTSLRNVMLHEKFDEKEKASTNIKVTKVDAETWKEVTHDGLMHHLKKIVKEKRQPNSPSMLKRLNKNASKISFNLWDFAGDAVFDSLHHLFLTEYGCYILVFNSKRVLSEDHRAQALKYLKFWLFSKKIHAPKAPVFLVGTHSDELTEVELSEVDEIISMEVLEINNFGEIPMERFCFMPVDSKHGTGVEELKKKIVGVVKSQKYLKVEVPIAFMRVLELLADSGKDYIVLSEVAEMALACGIKEDVIEIGLKFLSYRGLITFFHQHELVRRIVILRPQWLIDGLRCVFFDPSKEAPKYDSKLARDFRRFKRDRVMSYELIHSIWEHAGHPKEVRKFLLRVMLMSSLIGEYNFDKKESYLVPALFKSKTMKKLSFKKEEYSGPFFFIDFSGKYDPKILSDAGETYVRYRPFGFFERLVSLCVEHSARFKESMQPSVDYEVARLSFGVDVDFLLEVCNDERDQPLWIKIACVNDTPAEEAQDLLKTIYSMISGLKTDFFTTAKKVSQLAVSILLPSSDETGNLLADYGTLQFNYSAMKQTGQPTIIRPSKLQNKKVKLEAYSQWFENDDTVQGQASLTPLVDNIQYTPDVVPLKKLPENMKYHCFLSYKQKSAIDVVGKQFLILKNKGYKCWFDQEFQGEINLANMQEGVRQSMCYILFLSRDIFPSPYVEAELTIAVEQKKPIILLHHPDTGKVGYWSFGDYINTAPDILKPLFADIESIQLQRRYYLEEAVTRLLDTRLSEIHTAAMENAK